MHILMVAHAFPRWEGDVAGAFVWRLAEALVDRGHAVTALAPADRGEVGEAMLGRVRVRRLRYAAPRRETLAYTGTMHTSAAGGLGAGLAFLGLLRAFLVSVEEACAADRVDLVHAHWWVPGGLAARLARRGPQPLVLTVHGTDIALAAKVAGAALGLRAVAGGASVVTAVSRVLARTTERLAGLPADDVAVMPMPLELAHGPTRTGDRRHGAVFVGRLTTQKRVDVLLEAMALLAVRGQALDLTVVGDGPERERLESRAAQPDLAGRVRFIGAIPPEQVPPHLNGARVAVLPSVNEGLGLVVAEALVAGTPVVGVRSGGIPDLLTEPDAGVLVPPDDATALADAIARVRDDARFLSGARRAGTILAERLSPASVAAGYERVYRSALAGCTR